MNSSKILRLADCSIWLARDDVFDSSHSQVLSDLASFSFETIDFACQDLDLKVFLSLETIDLRVKNLDLLGLDLLSILVQGLISAETLLLDLLEGNKNLVLFFDQVLNALD